jgi:signal peptidase
MVPPRDDDRPSDDRVNDDTGTDATPPDDSAIGTEPDDVANESGVADSAGDGLSEAAGAPSSGSSDDRRSGPDGRETDRPSAEGADDRTGATEHGAPEESEGGEWKRFGYDIVSSIAAVLLVGLLLFAVSGVWPPMVAIESPSMDPHMEVGDLVFVMDEQRFPGEGAAADTGVVTAAVGAETGYRKFQRPGDVIVYKPNGDGGETPIIHRAVVWVEEGEDWTDDVNRNHLGSSTECSEVRYCPAPHDGFITKGDANPTYDQVGRGAFSSPVKPEWVIGTAEIRIPKLGWIRLRSGQAGAAAGTAAPAGSNGSPTPGTNGPENASVAVATAT